MISHPHASLVTKLSLPAPAWPVLAGLGGSAFLAGVYFSIVSLTESPAHAHDLFQQQAGLIVPLILGFGIQAGLYTVLRLRLFVPVKAGRSSGTVTGASGATSTAAMIACCAHHVTDVLPVLGLSAAAAFLAEYQQEFMLLGLVTTLGGILFMLFVLGSERKKAIRHAAQCSATAAD